MTKNTGFWMVKSYFGTTYEQNFVNDINIFTLLYV